MFLLTFNFFLRLSMLYMFTVENMKPTEVHKENSNYKLEEIITQSSHSKHLSVFL